MVKLSEIKTRLYLPNRLGTLQKLIAAKDEVDPTQRYHVVAYSYDHFKVWARQFAIDTRYFRYISEPHDLEGLQDYNLVVLPRYRIDPGAMKRIIGKAKAIYDTQLMYPVAEKGVIVKWVEYKKAGKDVEKDTV